MGSKVRERKGAEVGKTVWFKNGFKKASKSICTFGAVSSAAAGKWVYGRKRERTMKQTDQIRQRGQQFRLQVHEWTSPFASPPAI